MDSTYQFALVDREQRHSYRTLQWEEQQKIFKEVMAASKSCRTNLERRHVTRYNFESDLDQPLNNNAVVFFG